MELLSIRGAFKKKYVDGAYSYSFTWDWDGNVDCQFSTEAGSYSIHYNTWSGSLEVSESCDIAAADFIRHVRNQFFSVVDKTCIKEHPEDVYFDIDGKIVRMDHTMCGLRGIYPGANVITMIWEGQVPWIN